jgi:hypothetical protein
LSDPEVKVVVVENSESGELDSDRKTAEESLLCPDTPFENRWILESFFRLRF